MKKNGKRIALLIFSLLPLVLLGIFYQKLPDQVPLQWNAAGVARYGEKRELFPLAGLSVLFAFLMPFMAKIDPRKKNYERFSKTYDVIILILVIFMTAMMGITVFESLHPGALPVVRVVSGMVALLFILLGNLMPKVKSNFFTGVKTPWALSNDVVWNKTQRLGGKLFFFGGLALLLSAFLLPNRWMSVVTVVIVAFICIVPTVASYFWYQQEVGTGKK